MMRRPIDSEIKIVIALRFLAIGESYESLMYQFRVHSSTIFKFIPIVCNKIYETYNGQFLRLPDTTEERGSTLRLFVPLIVNQNFTTIKGFSQLFYLR